MKVIGKEEILDVGATQENQRITGFNADELHSLIAGQAA